MFYHKITLSSFNYWFVAGPLMLLMMAALGSLRYALDLERNCIMKRKHENFLRLMRGIAILLDIILHGMIIEESMAGIVQLALNWIGDDADPSWSIMVMFCGFVMTLIAGYEILYLSARCGEWLMHGLLIDIAKRRAAEKVGQTTKLMERSSDSDSHHEQEETNAEEPNEGETAGVSDGLAFEEEILDGTSGMYSQYARMAAGETEEFPMPVFYTCGLWGLTDKVQPYRP